MKIAFVNHDLGPYGATKSLLDLIDGLRAKEVECFVIIPKKNPFLKDGPLESQLIEKEIPYFAIDYRLWVHKKEPHLLAKIKQSILRFPNNRLYRLFKNIKAAYQLKSQLEQWGIDLVYTNTTVIPIGAIVASQLKKPHVWHIREFLRLDHSQAMDWGNNFFANIANKSSAIVMISNAIRDYYCPPLSSAISHVIYNGVARQKDFNTIQIKKQSLLAQKNVTYTFCILGRISQKGQEEAVRGLNILIKRGIIAKLIIAGRGNTKSIQALASQFEISEMIEITGHIDDPYTVYFRSDACIVCSPHEAFGRVTVEAMAAAIPVIGKQNTYSGTQELIQHEKTGLLYHGDESALAEAMERLVSNPEWGTLLGKEGWEYAKEHYNRERYVDQIYHILKKVSE